jgi:arabinogalactan endo-1,4-beta-galactosidase
MMVIAPDCSPDTLVMMAHWTTAAKQMYRWWFDNIVKRGPFDLIGASYYPFWHGTFADLQTNLNDIALRYDKDIIVVETAYPFTLEDDDNYENIIRIMSNLAIPSLPKDKPKCWQTS